MDQMEEKRTERKYEIIMHMLLNDNAINLLLLAIHARSCTFAVISNDCIVVGRSDFTSIQRFMIQFLVDAKFDFKSTHYISSTHVHILSYAHTLIPIAYYLQIMKFVSVQCFWCFMHKHILVKLRGQVTHKRTSVWIYIYKLLSELLRFNSSAQKKRNKPTTCHVDYIFLSLSNLYDTDRF